MPANSLVHVLIVLIVIGVLLWLVETTIPLDPTIRRIIQVVGILLACLYILRVFAIF